jgi:hypothetical protein
MCHDDDSRAPAPPVRGEVRRAPHSFFDRSYADWKDAGADAWRRILAFVDRQAAPARS